MARGVHAPGGCLPRNGFSGYTMERAWRVFLAMLWPSPLGWGSATSGFGLAAPAGAAAALPCASAGGQAFLPTGMLSSPEGRRHNPAGMRLEMARPCVGGRGDLRALISQGVAAGGRAWLCRLGGAIQQGVSPLCGWGINSRGRLDLGKRGAFA